MLYTFKKHRLETIFRYNLKSMFEQISKDIDLIFYLILFICISNNYNNRLNFHIMVLIILKKLIRVNSSSLILQNVCLL